MLEVGSVFADRYRIIEVLGQGGMGAVYKAEDLKLRETIALKLLLPDYQHHPEVIKRFFREIRLALKITHENVVRIYDLGECDQMHYISMEYIDGTDLKTLIEQRGPYPVGEGIGLMKQVMRGLAVAHTKGIVHRDMKPQNIIVTDKRIAKIVDFGIAKAAADHQSATAGMTKKDMIIGTPEYMAPEQALARSVDARTDIYALGIVMFEMFTGEPPFSSDTAVNLLIKQVKQQPPDPCRLNADLPSNLSRIILKALAKDPRERFQSVNEMIAALDNLTTGKQNPLVIESDKAVDLEGATSLNAFEVLEEVVEELVEEVEAPGDIQTLFERGRQLFKERQFSKALSFFHRVIELDPTYAQAYDYLEIAGQHIAKDATVNRLLANAEAAFTRKSYAEAFRDFQEVLKFSPDNPTAQIGLKKTTAHYTPPAGEPASQAHVATPGQASPSDTAARPSTAPEEMTNTFAQGKHLFDQKRYSEAFDIFQTLLDKNPNDAQAYEYLELSKAAQSAQEEIEHHYLTAKRLLEEGDRAACQQELAIALDFDSNHQASLELLNTLRLEANDPDILKELVAPASDRTSVGEAAAGQAKTRALKQDPEFVELTAQIKKLLQEHNYDQILEELDRARTKFPQWLDKLDEQVNRIKAEKKKYLIRNQLHKAEESYKAQKYHQAMASLKKALEIEPHSQQIQQLLVECRARIGEERGQKEREAQRKVSRKASEAESAPDQMPGRTRQPVLLYTVLGIVAVIVIGCTFLVFPRFKPWLGKHYHEEGLVAFNGRQYDKAVTAFQKAYEYQPTADVLEKLGEAHFYAGNYSESQSAFKQLLAEKGDVGKYNYFLGQIALKTGKTDQAKEAYLKALKGNPNDASTQANLGLIYLEERNFPLAIQHFQKSLSLKSNQPTVRLELARAYSQNHDYDLATEHYQRLIKENPNYDVPYNELGRVYINQGSYGSAIATLKKHPAFHSGDAALFYNLGMCYEKMAQAKQGDWSENIDNALEYYQKAFVVNMGHEDVVHRLTKLLVTRKKNDHAIQVYSQYLADYPDDSSAHVGLAELYQSQKKYSQASEHLNRATQLDVNNYEIWNKLGDLHRKSGNKNEAKNAYRKSLAINPNQSAIKSRLRSL
ncbi:tetratricopeptide repeat protein [bacterium]|nr:tetratricopeptide repeat protein [bacterium]